MRLRAYIGAADTSAPFPRPPHKDLITLQCKKSLSKEGQGESLYPYLFYWNGSKCLWVDIFKLLASQAFAMQSFFMIRSLQPCKS